MDTKIDFTHSLPAPGETNHQNQHEYLEHQKKNLDFIKKKLKEKKDKSKEKKQKKKYKIGERNEFPTLFEVYGGERKKKIKKRKKNSNRKLISRFDIDLINISEKINEVLTHNKKFRGIVPTNTKYIQKRMDMKEKKKSKIKKCIEELTKAEKIEEMDKDKFCDLNLTQLTFDDLIMTKKKRNSIKFRIRKIFNNSKDIKINYDQQIEIREYVNNTFEKNLDYKILEFINHLNFSQLLKKKIKPLKYKKRIVSGFNEVLKSLKFTQKKK